MKSMQHKQQAKAKAIKAKKARNLRRKLAIDAFNREQRCFYSKQRN